MQVVFEPPDKNQPGFLKRQKQALAYEDAIKKKELTEQTIDNLVGFLSAYVKVPEDREEAKEMLLDASEAQFLEMLDAIKGVIEEDNQDTKKNGNGQNSGSKGQRRTRRLKHTS